MTCSIAELRNKEVICKLNGTRIGNVDDVELDVNTSNEGKSGIKISADSIYKFKNKK